MQAGLNAADSHVDLRATGPDGWKTYVVRPGDPTPGQRLRLTAAHLEAGPSVILPHRCEGMEEWLARYGNRGTFGYGPIFPERIEARRSSSGRMRTPDLDEQLDRLENVSPTFLAKIIHFLREPKRRRLRLSVGGLLIIGGCFFFLPILCLEMIPIGLMLIAIDVPVLRRPVAHMIAWIERGVGFLITLWMAVSARLPTRATARHSAKSRH